MTILLRTSGLRQFNPLVSQGKYCRSEVKGQVTWLSRLSSLVSALQALTEKRTTSPQPMWPGLRDHWKANTPTPEVSLVPVARARWAPVASCVSPSGRGQFAVGDDPALENGLSPSPFMALGEALGLRMPACKLGLKPCLPGPLVRPTHQWSSWRPRSWFRHPTLHLAGGNPDICHHLRFVLKSERDIFLLGESVHLSKQVTFLGPYKF